jgi:hypothetical protein
VEGEEIKVSEFCPEVQANLSALKAVRNCRMWGAYGVFRGSSEFLHEVLCFGMLNY